MYEWLAAKAGRDQVRPGSWTATIYDGVERGDIPERPLTSCRRRTSHLRSTPQPIRSAGRSSSSPTTQSNGSSCSLIPTSLLAPIEKSSGSRHRSTTSDAASSATSRLPVFRCPPIPTSWCRTRPYCVRAGSGRIQSASTSAAITSANSGLATASTLVSARVARLEGHAILSALARRVERFQAGEGTLVVNNLVHGLDTLPVTVRPLWRRYFERNRSADERSSRIHTLPTPTCAKPVDEAEEAHSPTRASR